MSEEYLPTTPATRIEFRSDGTVWAVNPVTGEEKQLKSDTSDDR